MAVIKTVKVMSSLVHIELDGDEFVTRFEDRWCVLHFLSVGTTEAHERLAAAGMRSRCRRAGSGGC